MEYMTAEQAAEAAKGYTFETVWAALMEMRANINSYIDESRESKLQGDEALAELKKTVAETTKTVEETSKIAAETSKEVEKTSKEVEKTSKEVAKTTKIVADLSKNVGGLGNLQGRLTEAMFEAELWKKFNEIDLPFNKQSSHYKFVENGRVLAEADFFLENGQYAMPVEIKTELSVGDIDEHIERIATIRKYMDAHGDGRKLVSAIAGEIVSENAMNYAHKRGVYVLKQTGDSVAIAAAPHYFKRHEW